MPRVPDIWSMKTKTSVITQAYPKYIGCLFLATTLLLTQATAAHAQSKAPAANTYDSSFRFYYYDQKIDHFANMPIKRKAWVWLGDSITDGGEWAELIGRKNVLNRGISADNTFGILYRLDEVLRHQPQKLFILIGINDIGRNIPTEVSLRNYATIIDRIKAGSPGTAIYIQTLMPTNNEYTNFPNHQNKTDKIEAFNNGLKQLAKEKGTYLVDLYQPFCNAAGKLDAKYTNDGLHLTGQGYAHWKQILTAAKAL